MEISNIDLKSAEQAVKMLFESLNIELEPETPKRFISMIYDLTKCHNISNHEIADMVNKSFEIDTNSNSQNMVLIRDIDAFSLCEHHIALIYDMKISVAYIPKNLVLGLSKIVRAVSMVCKRLQLQEKIGNDIVDVMQILTKSKDIAVHIRAKHSCITARGIQNASAETITTNFSGKFLENNFLRDSFLKNIK